MTKSVHSDERVDAPVRLHQVLHGYDGGHRLLACSGVELQPQAERLILGLSDASGSSLLPGFETYLTGYPVSNSDYYALARTWVAPELPRPGCVWTHTLLIHVADLAHLQDLPRLTSLFRRPQSVEDTEAYESVRELTAAATRGPERQGISAEAARAVLRGLYAFPDAPVAILAGDAAQHELLLLAVWDQQWPRLRRTFRFCTGAVAPRRLQQAPFDLQVVPPSAARQLWREFPSAILIANDHGDWIAQGTPDSAVNADKKASSLRSPGAGDGHRATPSAATGADSERDHVMSDADAWVEVLVDNLLHGHAGDSVRTFLAQFAADAPNPRAAAAPLASIRQMIDATIRTERPLTDLVEWLDDVLPSGARGARIRSIVFGSVSAPGSILRGLSEAKLLEALAAAPRDGAFDLPTLDIRRRAAALWRTDPKALTQALEHLRPVALNRMGEQLLLGLADAVAPQDAAALAQLKPGLVYILVRERPELATRKDIWQADPDAATQVLGALSVLPPERRPDVRAVVDVVWRTRADWAVLALWRLYGDAVGLAYLSLIDSEPSPSIPESAAWQAVLALHRGAATSWLAATSRPSLGALVILASVLTPDDVMRLPVAPWVQASRRAPDLTNWGRDGVVLLGFALALGLSNPCREAAELVGNAFGPVHEAAWHNALPGRAWALLAPRLPSLPPWQAWDHTEQLRRALVHAFMQNEWHLQHFLNALSHPEAFARAMRYCRSLPEGRAFARSLAIGIESGELASRPFQTETIRDAVRKRPRFPFFDNWL